MTRRWAFWDVTRVVVTFRSNILCPCSGRTSTVAEIYLAAPPNREGWGVALTCLVVGATWKELRNFGASVMHLWWRLVSWLTLEPLTTRLRLQRSVLAFVIYSRWLNELVGSGTLFRSWYLLIWSRHSPSSRNCKVRCYVHNMLPVCLILSQLNLTACFFKKNLSAIFLTYRVLPFAQVHRSKCYKAYGYISPCMLLFLLI